MRFLYRPQTFAPFIGVCWGFGQFTISLWPFVLCIGDSAYGKSLEAIEKRLKGIPS